MREAPEALELAERAWSAAEGDEADAFVHAERSGFARYAASQVHQPTLIEDRSVTIRVVRDGRIGCASTNRTDDGALRAAADRAAEIADRSPVDPAFPGLPDPAPPPDVEGWDEVTAELGAAEQAARAWEAIEAAGDFGLYGYFTSGVTELAAASSKGVAVSQAVTDVNVVALAATDGRSGYADAASWKVGEVDAASVARQAAETAARTAGAEDPGPATYRTVLEPYAFGELLWYFGYSSLGALGLLEERSYFAGRIGERIFHPSFSLYDDARDPAGLPKAFDFEGVPKQKVTLVEAGVARDVVWDRRTGARAGRDSTGHALVAPAQSYGPQPFNLSVPAGDAPLEELVARVGEGIYATRLHYLNIVDPREGIITGMTRDGTFRIEGGKITRPLVNLRFTTSFPELVASLLGLGDRVRLVNQSDFYGERYAFGALVPAAATEAFTVVGSGSGPGL
ncbi:MAG TPA: TldD/PmbA family protein [Gaiellaceae bacterium]|nr:TldD/PmbA family protein [Gaiellaceae bacterium]